MGEEKIVEINVEKFMTFREGNNNQLKEAEHALYSVNSVFSDCGMESGGTTKASILLP